MIERKHRYGNLVFDRDAIVRAALRAYVEAIFGAHPFNRVSFTACAVPRWTGDLQRGAFCNDNQEGDYDVVGWTEAGVVGLAYQLGFGPIEHLDLPVEAVTGGPDDVRGALPGLPAELEPALVLAAGMLDVGENHGEKQAGVGFWLHGDHVAGTLFDDPIGPGARQLVMWGLLRGGRLWPENSYFSHPDTRAVVLQCAKNQASMHALMDTVVNRRLGGPTEFTTDEIATLFPTPPDPEALLGAQRMLQKVGITWPGSPEIPEPPPRTGRNPFLPPPTMVFRRHPLDHIGNLGFDRDAIVRAALRAYVEVILAWVDPLERHQFPACADPNWTGDLQRGAFYNGDGYGNYDVVAWTEAGVVGLTYQLGSGPLEQLGLSVDAVTGGPDDVRGALPGLPAELEPALVLAASMLDVGPQGEKLAGVGFWLHGNCVAGTLFDNPRAPGVPELALWGSLGGDRLRLRYHRSRGATIGPKCAPIRGLVDAVTSRALTAPTELTTDELATLLPTPPDPEQLLAAQRMLQKVGITWPGSPEIPEPPKPTGRNPLLPRP